MKNITQATREIITSDPQNSKPTPPHKTELVSITAISNESFSHIRLIFQKIFNRIDASMFAKSVFAYSIKRDRLAFSPLLPFVDQDYVLCVNVNGNPRIREKEWQAFRFFNIKTKDRLEKETVISFCPVDSRKSRQMIRTRGIMPILLEANRTGILNVLLVEPGEIFLLKYSYFHEKHLELQSAMSDAKDYNPFDKNSMSDLERACQQPRDRLDYRVADHYLFYWGTLELWNGKMLDPSGLHDIS